MPRTDAEWISHFNAALTGTLANPQTKAHVGSNGPGRDALRNLTGIVAECAALAADAAAELIEKRRKEES